MRVSAAMTSSGNVKVTARDGRPNFCGRPRRDGKQLNGSHQIFIDNITPES